MRWNGDDSAFHWIVVISIFSMGLLAPILGPVGFACSVACAVVVGRLSGMWVRDRFGIEKVIPDDRLDRALRQPSVREGLRVLSNRRMPS